MTIEITARNLAAVREFSFQLPDAGGLTVLTGHNGAGKTTLINACKRALGGNAQVAKSDGTLRGAIELCGVKVSFTASGARRSGELMAASLEGRFDISAIVDPQIKSPEAADLARAKGILAVTGHKPDLTLFDDACGGRSLIMAVAKPATHEAKTLVEMATALKRDLEERARLYRNQGKMLVGEATALRESAADVDVKVATDEQQLIADQTAAIRHEAKLEEQARAASDAAVRAQEAAAAMAKAKAEYTGPTVEDATAELAKANVARGALLKRAQELEKALELARSDLSISLAGVRSAQAARDSALAHETLLGASQQALQEATSVQAPTDADLAASAEAVQQTRQAVTMGHAARKAIADLAAATEKTTESLQHEARAEAIAGFATATFEEVLTGAVDVPGISFSEGRMFVGPPIREGGRELFARLGRGERCRIAVDIAVRRVHELGLDLVAILTLCQELFEGLDPQNVQALDEHLQSVKANMITAKATDGPLRVEV